MDTNDEREARERRCFSQVLWFVAAASLLQFIPWRLPLEHRQDACTRSFGRFAPMARAYCPVEGGVSTESSTHAAAIWGPTQGAS